MGRTRFPRLAPAAGARRERRAEGRSRRRDAAEPARIGRLDARGHFAWRHLLFLLADFGERGVLDRFGQIEPKVFVASDGYWYAGKRVEIADKLKTIAASLPTAGKL